MEKLFSDAKFALRRFFITDKWKKELSNRDFTIISNDCTAGMLYHDLDLHFNTPTINLFFDATDYIKFCENIKYYIAQELVEIESNKPYPVGLLDDVKIYFKHYNTFHDAKTKWDERKKRINFENIFLLANDRNGCTESHIKEFEQLPYPRVLIMHNNTHYPHTFYLPGFENQKSVGVILHYKSKLSIHRYYDSFDFVKWLNNTN